VSRVDTESFGLFHGDVQDRDMRRAQIKNKGENRITEVENGSN